MARRGVTTENLGEFIEQNVAHEPNTGCWLWTDTDNGLGYGQLCVDGKQITAHRASYKHHKGNIPAGMYVCHTCDVRACVNPDHLFLGTHKDNMRDAVTKGLKASQILTKEQAIEVLSFLEENTWRGAQSYVAKKYGVTRSTINKIAKGHNWAWLK